MKKPSRLMPKYTVKKHGFLLLFVLWFIFLTFLSTLTFNLYTNTIPTLIFLTILIIVTISIYFENKKIKQHYNKLYQNRKNLSICDFVREFDYRVVDTWIIRAVYEEIQSYLDFDKPISIKGSDNIETDLYIDDEELDLDIIERISQRTGREINNLESNPYYGKVETIKDLVHLFNHQKINKIT